MDDIKRYLEAEQKCVQLIAQFLLYNDFNKSLPVFIEEAVSLDYHLSDEELSRVDHIKREDVKNLISVFQSSDHAQFFKVWTELIPDSVKEIFDYKKLTFYLHVHFAIYPFRENEGNKDENKEKNKDENLDSKEDANVEHVDGNISDNTESDVIDTPVKRLEVIKETASPSWEYDTDSLDQSQVVIDTEKNVEEDDRKSRLDQTIYAESETNKNIQQQTGMETLKQFLASEGETFSSQQEFLPFFALPYVTNPDKHPSFTTLFQEKWLNSLNERFYEFIYQYSCGEVAPKIVKLCEEPAPDTANVRRDNSNNSPSQSNAADMLRRYKQAKRKFSKLHKDHQNLIGVAAELTQALENSVRGQAVDLRATLSKCSVIFPELFSSESASRNSSPHRLKVPSVEPLKNPKVLCCSELDVYKIKSHLVSASIKTKLLLLQAIRWRMTQGSSEERDQVVVWLSRHDLLSVYTDLVRGMLQPPSPTPHPLQQAASRLLNAVASLRAGRDYLSACDAFLTHLISCVKQENGVRLDSVTADMLLATLQKLSLRRRPRLLMIERSVVEWLVGRLSGETERLYTLEYSTALLLNLCLHLEGRERCPTSTLKLLTDLLDTGQLQIMPMVASTLYCLLSHDRLNQTARQTDLESVLAQQSRRYVGQPHIRRQILTLLQLLRGELPSEAVLPVSEEPSEDDLDDPDTLEAELDSEDPVRATGDDLSGEQLLMTRYRKIFPSHGIVCPHAQQAEIAILPSTPRSRPPTREQ